MNTEDMRQYFEPDGSPRRLDRGMAGADSLERLVRAHVPYASKLPWEVRQFPNGEPWIADADGYTVTQVISSIRYGDERYIVRNRANAEMICALANLLCPNTQAVAPRAEHDNGHE